MSRQKQYQRRGRLIGLWLPDEVYLRFLAAREAFGFRKDGAFAKYIVINWLEEKGCLYAPFTPRPQLVGPPAGGMRDGQGGPTWGDEPQLEKGKGGGGT